MLNEQSDNRNLIASNPEIDEINLGELFATLVDNKWLIGLITLLATSLGIAKALLDTPIYQADALLQIQEHKQSLGALEAVTGILESKSPVLAEIEIIKSRMILGAAAQNLNTEIIARPDYFPKIGEAIARRFQQRNPGQVSSPVFGLEHYAWGGEAIQVDSFNVPAAYLNKDFVLIGREQGQYQLMMDDRLILEGKVGELASQPVSDLEQPVTVFVSLLKARPNTRFLLQRLAIVKAIGQLQQSLSVSEKGRNTGILLFNFESPSPEIAQTTVNEIAEVYFRMSVELKSAEAQKTLDFLDQQLPMIKDQLEAATTALNDYRTQKGSVDLTAETQSVLRNVVELRTQITLLQQKRDELRQKFTESHPTVKAIDHQISRLEGQYAAHNKRIEVLPETQKVILRLSRDVQVNSELYSTLLNNSQTLRVAKAGTVGDVRIIDKAVLPTQPIKPKKPLIVGVSLMIGLIAGIALAFIRKAMHRGVEDPEQIEKRLNIPVYATIPHSSTQEKLFRKYKKSNDSDFSLLSLANKEDLAIESLRSLRTTLHFAFLEAQNNIIMITGPSPGIGKTFVSSNLAVVLADAGKKILLIDGDMRKGLLHKVMGQERDNGLSDLISDSVKLEQVIRTISGANIDFISTGSLPPNPSELLLHERFNQLLETISKNYDHVIIDSPPILAVTDAGIIGRSASATLMVVKAGEHPMRELEQSAKRLTQAGINVKGIIFNDIPQTASRYGYGYGYSKYVYQYNYQKAN